MITLKFTERDTEDYNKWISFYPKKDNNGFSFKYCPWWYFEPRPIIITNVTSLLTIVVFCILGFSFWSLLLLPCLFFSWGQIFIRLPYNSGKNNTADYPEYGLTFYSIDGEFPRELWIRNGKKSKTICMPWNLQWVRTSLLLKDGTWAQETKQQRQEFWNDKWAEIKFKEEHPYIYNLNSGNEQNVTATITIEEREWRRQWLPFTTLFNRVDRGIEIEFSDEVGERAGSWKGGVVGCSYSMKKLNGGAYETPLECLRRMEQERRFR